MKECRHDGVYIFPYPLYSYPLSLPISIPPTQRGGSPRARHGWWWRRSRPRASGGSRRCDRMPRLLIAVGGGYEARLGARASTGIRLCCSQGEGSATRETTQKRLTRLCPALRGTAPVAKTDGRRAF